MIEVVLVEREKRTIERMIWFRNNVDASRYSEEAWAGRSQSDQCNSSVIYLPDASDKERGVHDIPGMSLGCT